MAKKRKSTPPFPSPSSTPPTPPDIETTSDSALIRNNDDYIVETIFPRREIHIIGGSSHSGKTTLLFHIINLWSRREAIFGHESFPLPFCYVSAVHSIDLARATAKRVGVPDGTPILSTVDEEQASTFEDLIALSNRL